MKKQKKWVKPTVKVYTKKDVLAKTQNNTIETEGMDMSKTGS
jgi:hypothetical protein